METLVDCGCETRVHSDGSGVEIDYCETHVAAACISELDQVFEVWTLDRRSKDYYGENCYEVEAWIKGKEDSIISQGPTLNEAARKAIESGRLWVRRKP